MAWVSVWPPSRSFASYSVTSCARDSSQALAIPEMPEPITAMRTSVARLRAHHAWRCGAETRHRLQVPHQPARGECAQHVVGEVQFPPAKTLACGTGKMMMVVVPAFAECDQREQPVVAA